MARAHPRGVTAAPADTRGAAVNRASSDLLDASLRLLRLLEKPEDIPVVAPLIQQAILYRLLSGPVGPRLLQIAITETPSNKIGRAIARMKENFTRPLRIEDLAGRVGMSVSSLHHHFKAVTTMTPMQYQKQLRPSDANGAPRRRLSRLHRGISNWSSTLGALMCVASH